MDCYPGTAMPSLPPLYRNDTSGRDTPRPGEAFTKASSPPDAPSTENGTTSGTGANGAPQ